MHSSKPKLRARSARDKLSTPVMVTLISLLVLLSGVVIFFVFFNDGAERAACDPPPEGQTLAECELEEAHWRFNHIASHDTFSRSWRHPMDDFPSSNVNSHGIEYRHFLNWMHYRYESGAELDAFDEFFMIQDAIRTRLSGPGWREGPMPYTPESDPEVAAYVAWSVENFEHGPDLLSERGELILRRWDFANALARIFLEYRTSLEPASDEEWIAFMGEEGICGLLTRRSRQLDVLAPLSPEAIIALVRAYSDPEYVLDMRGLLDRGDDLTQLSHLDEIYENSLHHAGINPHSLPLIGGPLTRYFENACFPDLRRSLQSAYWDGETHIDICELQSSSFRSSWTGYPELLDRISMQHLHPACPHPAEEPGADS